VGSVGTCTAQISDLVLLCPRTFRTAPHRIILPCASCHPSAKTPSSPAARANSETRLPRLRPLSVRGPSWSRPSDATDAHGLPLALHVVERRVGRPRWLLALAWLHLPLALRRVRPPSNTRHASHRRTWHTSRAAACACAQVPLQRARRCACCSAWPFWRMSSGAASG